MARRQYLGTPMSCEHWAASGTDLDDARLRAAIVGPGYEVTALALA